MQKTFSKMERSFSAWNMRVYAEISLVYYRMSFISLSFKLLV